ncbi:MAG: 2Fe-2S iron-sulfur cluster-binding protein [Parvibaculaceae bacterium]
MNAPITLTVNGERFTVEASPRTQLAEILRDRLDLTGTHLGCEQGVCGACTVMADGKPIRSCIAFAGSCDGVRIETVEGFADDRTMQRLRSAFSRHHALQCGFCTPGMLVTARDIVARFGDPDESTVRRELAGNLCRCTGYVGIVAAILDVIAERNGLGERAEAAAAPLPVPRKGFTPFEAARRKSAPPRPGSGAARVRAEGNWTVVQRDFVLEHPPERVWALFSDMKKVGSCVPGASVDSVTENTFAGSVEVRFGLIKASIGGTGVFENHGESRSGFFEGRGEDRQGRSQVRGRLDYRILSGPQPASAAVEVDFRFEIQGRLAQFNRPELVAGFADHILAQFATTCDGVLAGREIGAAQGLSATGVGLAVLRAWLKSLIERYGKSRQS